MDNLRNFCIIAHIDHGKSTLADRFLEITGTVDARRMKDQYLDQLELERERGITVKMAPVRMIYHPHQFQNESNLKLNNSELNKNLKFKIKNSDSEYILNLIDTPGHSDFSYEVSRALAAVEGAILLVDGTQGIQAQTVANLKMAREANLVVIGAVNKIDLLEKEQLEKVVEEVSNLLSVNKEEIFKVSAKNGEGVENLLQGVIKKIPPPIIEGKYPRALVFDSFYDSHKGIVAAVKVFGGTFKSGDSAFLVVGGRDFKIKELGYFSPELESTSMLREGEIGYIATGIKDPDQLDIGDTIAAGDKKFIKPLEGYKKPNPVVFVSFYPEDSDDYSLLRQVFRKLRLNDSSLVIEEDKNEILGKGFKLGFLGKLHYEITEERVRKEFGVKTINTLPSLLYKVKTREGWREITRPEDLSEDFLEIWEQMAKVDVILPVEYLSNFVSAQRRFRMRDFKVENLRNSVKIEALIPLMEMVEDFDDWLKSITEGYGSFSYEIVGFEKSDLLKVDIFVNGELLPGMSRFLPKEKYEKESRQVIKKLKDLIPRRQYPQPIQAKVASKVIARETVPALKKNVTAHLYGGDRTRKMKLWKKQKEGKKKLKELGGVKLDPDVFKKILGGGLT